MRLLIAVVAATFAIALGASAQAAGPACPYDDVPNTHWAYKALDCLTGEGVLDGYPADFFAGNKLLTRYEFAQAVTRLTDTIAAKGAAHEVEVLASSLRSEFADQLESYSGIHGCFFASAALQQAQLRDVAAATVQDDARLDSLDARVDRMQSAPDWKGEFAYRWQLDQRSGEPGHLRQLVCFNLGYTQQLSSELSVGFRLSTVTDAGFGTNPFAPLGATASPLGTARIGLDEAYVKYSPKWGGTYAESNGQRSPKVELLAGELPHRDAH